jgi:UDP-N-acetylmuramate dehydrogenase
MVRPRRVSLSRYTTLGVGGEAELWEVDTLDDLREATREPYRILGGGSNLLVADDGVNERVVKLGASFNDLKNFNGRNDLWLGAATPLPGLVRRAEGAGLSGLEGLLGIPAVLGGAVRMNAGTRFGELADRLVEVELYVNGGLERLPAHSLGFGYRKSRLPDGAVVTRARLRLTPSSPKRVGALMAKVDAARKGQPKVKSAGCAFKNPAGDSAGRIIDAAGLKGLRVGRAMVACEHANFIVNLGGASAEDVHRLLELIRMKITVPLELEWERWG